MTSTRWPGSGLAVLALFALLVGGGCRPSVPILCYRSTLDSASGGPTDEDFHRLLFGEISLQRNTLARTLCTGEPNVPAEASPHCPGEPGTIEPRPVSAERIVVRELDERYTIVWGKTHRREDGMILGPVGLVETLEDGLALRALGYLTAPSYRPRFRWARIHGRRYVSVESSPCAGGSSGAGCGRVLRFLERDGPMLRMAETVDEHGRCVGKLRIPLYATASFEIEDGLIRELEYSAAYEPRGGALELHEQVRVTERDPTSEEAPPRQVRTSEWVRRVVERDGVLTIEGEDLWHAIRVREGSVRSEEAPPEAPSVRGRP